MSQENVEIGNLVNAAFNRGEVDAALEVFAPDAELLDLQNAPDQPAAIQGIDRIRDAVNLWIGAFDELHADVQEWIDAGDAVVGAVHWHGQGKATGISVDSHQFDIYEFSDGKIVRATLGYRWAMLEEHVEIIRRAFEAWQRGEPRAHVVDAEIEWDSSTSWARHPRSRGVGGAG